MDNLARKLDQDPVVEEVGTIVEAAPPRSGGGGARCGRAFVVRTPHGELTAERAASCLVEPTGGDRVLVAGSRREGFYVLAILTREDGAKTPISVDGDLEIRLPSGRFVVAAQEGVEIVSGKDVSVTSGTVRVHAAVGDLAVETLTMVGALVRAEVEIVKLFAERFDSLVDRFSQRVKRSYRAVEESDQLRAGRIDYVAKKTMSLHAENAIVTAEELVKVDGEQIHMG